jgi:hypothetical protein
VTSTLLLVLTQQVRAQAPQQLMMLSLDQCQLTGGAISATKKASGWELAVSSSEPKGSWTEDVQGDTGTYPLLAFQIPELSRECAWSLVAYDSRAIQRHVLQQDGPHFGQFVFDLRKIDGWTGRKHFRLEFTVRGPVGRSNWILLKEPGLFRASPFAAGTGNGTQTVMQSERMNRALVNASTQEVALALMNARGAEWEWGGALSKVTVDTDLFPFAELNVRQLSASANFRFGVGGMTSGPVDRYAGVLSFNYRDASHWQGKHEVEIQTILGGVGGRIAYAPIRFLPYPSLSAALVARAEATVKEEPALESGLTTGPFRLDYEPANGLFRIRRKDGTASLVTRFIEMEGIAMTPTEIHKTRSASGDQLSYQASSGNRNFKVQIETFSVAEGMLHWRVTATPSSDTQFASCGHELCYVPSRADGPMGLRRIAGQSWSASGLAHVVAPGLGTALYFQNYTALNTLFERCHTTPRFWVSASAKTFGFPNPLDTRATFPADVPVVLSDAWLYLAPAEDHGAPQNNERDATRFLQGLAAIFARLPDKPETQWLDWPKLARHSLQDLYNGECWASWENGIYLKSYVGTVGASPQLTGMQDVIGPLLAFLNQTGEGRDMYNRLRAEIPHFWSEKRGSILMFANDPNSNWWSIEQMVGVCRAALNGDADAKAYCLKSGPAIIRLAQDSHYGFQHFTEYKDLIMNEKEFTGVFLLYMMQLYELSGDMTFVDEAKKAAEQIASWDYSTAKLASFDAMACEGLARLFEATKDQRYLRISEIPLAGLLRNAWLWQCAYGHANGYSTFFGFNSDASGVDYITAADQHQVWYSLSQYYVRADSALSGSARYLTGEALRYIPQVAWYTYPTNLPPESLHRGVPFWHSKNLYALAIPVEDLNDGWRKNGSVGQELYGAGAAFEFASRAYVRVPEAGVLVYCEYPILKTDWDAGHKTLTVQVGGSPDQIVKFEIRRDTAATNGTPAVKDSQWSISYARKDRLQDVHKIQGTPNEGNFRFNVPGDSHMELHMSL